MTSTHMEPRPYQSRIVRKTFDMFAGTHRDGKGDLVYDLLNFVSEIATHHATGSGPRMAQGWIGTLISHEFDLENSCDAFDDFQDFFLERRLNGEVAMDLQRISS